jgi:hypothetical protein
MEYVFRPKEWFMSVRKRDPAKKFFPTKDIKFLVYTNDEIMGITERYIRVLSNLSYQEPTTATVNEMVMYLDRMKFLLGQIKYGAK